MDVDVVALSIVYSTAVQSEYAVRPYTRSGQYEFRPHLDIVTFSGSYSTTVHLERAVRVQATFELCDFQRCLRYDRTLEWGSMSSGNTWT